jgi:hypothetical protein
LRESERQTAVNEEVKKRDSICQVSNTTGLGGMGGIDRKARESEGFLLNDRGIRRRSGGRTKVVKVGCKHLGAPTLSLVMKIAQFEELC